MENEIEIGNDVINGSQNDVAMIENTNVIDSDIHLNEMDINAREQNDLNVNNREIHVFEDDIEERVIGDEDIVATDNMERVGVEEENIVFVEDNGLEDSVERVEVGDRIVFEENHVIEKDANYRIEDVIHMDDIAQDRIEDVVHVDDIVHVVAPRIESIVEKEINLDNNNLPILDMFSEIDNDSVSSNRDKMDDDLENILDNVLQNNGSQHLESHGKKRNFSEMNTSEVAPPTKKRKLFFVRRILEKLRKRKKK